MNRMMGARCDGGRGRRGYNMVYKSESRRVLMKLWCGVCCDFIVMCYCL